MIDFSKKILLSLLLPLFLLTQNSNIEKTKAASHLSNKLNVSHLPYVTKLSLGDPLYLDGLVLTNEDSVEDVTYTYSGYDSTNLGTQTITVNSGTNATAFEVYVTNELVRNTSPQFSELFISEIAYLDQHNIGIELFNPTSTLIDLASYRLSIEYNDKESSTISLDTFEIEGKDTFTISHLLSGDTLYDSASFLYEIDFEDATKFALTKDNVIIDQIELSPDNSWFNDINVTLNGNVIRRHYKISGPSPFFDTREWISVENDISNYGLHEVSTSITSVEEQAKAFARYVMFGAGMFAAGRVSEAFFELKTEYELMSQLSKEYFVSNKKVKVEGINESGKLVSVAFSEAHARISLLASRSGNPSFIPRNTGSSFNLGEGYNLLILGAVILFSVAGFIFFQFKRKKN